MSGFKKETRKEFYNFRCLIDSILNSDGENGEYFCLSSAKEEKPSGNKILEAEIYIEAGYKGYTPIFVVFRNLLEVEYDENGEYEVIDCERKILHEFKLSSEAQEQIPTGYNAVHDVSKWENINILENELWENLKDYL